MMKKSTMLPLLATAVSLFLTGCEGKLVEQVDLIPQAQSVTIKNGSFSLADLRTMQAPAEWTENAQTFAGLLQKSAGISLSVSDIDAPLSLVKNDQLGDEAYTLNIESGRITLQAKDAQGISHALATLHQLILTAKDNKLPVLNIQDKPRFGYRGLMLDCSRHFWTVDELKETLSQMSFFKLNTLQMHLTDNNAWRLAMDKYPELTEKGTFYPDFPDLSGKYYTTDDLKELVRYAQSLGIEIIPEVDLPGHSTALLAAMPQLSCKGGSFEAYPEELPFSQRKRGNENMICIGNPESIRFAQEVVDALIQIFPSPYIHLGGDEVPTNIWEKCPKCQALYKKEGMKEPGEIQDYFTRKMSEYIRSKGKTMVGWDEINDRHAATPEDMLTVWRDDGLKAQKAALERGIPVVMCPQHGCYLDWGYAGNSTRKVYEWDPITDQVSPEQASLVKGGQGALWTERVATQDRVEWMLYPRLAALSEVFWCEPSSRNWDDFYRRITAFYPVMKQIGINFYEDDALNEKEFAPTQEKPMLIRPASIDTNIPLNPPYHPEYAFDGKTNSFFWGGSTINPTHYFTVILTEPTDVNSIEVITGDSKDYITKADLLISADGNEFQKVGTFDELGQAKADIGGKPVKAVKIQVTGNHTCWPIIKEIILK
ncbi:family 20 glycosylhydrolase [Phocaeicola barnesiae]|uniref:glycoside hydrolase family 20 protein n=1 Tax=Phocaeicola barnesiae TaxID=376804 RepID=UPI0025A4144E|nr:family 20 glycosylhydrolase [Phocaeicola barnesiae]MDM8232845.1 family 20 glycosylhydrolase [Phocaeicola barnesiae]